MNEKKVVAVFYPILPYSRAPLVTLLLGWLNGSLGPRGENVVSLRLVHSRPIPYLKPCGPIQIALPVSWFRRPVKFEGNFNIPC